MIAHAESAGIHTDSESLVFNDSVLTGLRLWGEHSLSFEGVLKRVDLVAPSHQQDREEVGGGKQAKRLIPGLGLAETAAIPLRAVLLRSRNGRR